MQLLITRPEPDAHRLATTLAALGHTPLVLPLLDIVFDKTASTPKNYAALAFTSANGVRALSALLPPDDSLLSALVFAIGAQTAQAAQEAGWENIITCSPDNSANNNSVAEMAEMIIAHKHIITGMIAHIVGRHQAGDLVAHLLQVGLAAEKFVLYEARRRRPATFDPAIAEAILASPEDKPEARGVLLYSRRSAALFLEYWQTIIVSPFPTALPTSYAPDLQQTYRAFCLSPAIADDMQAHGFMAQAAAQTTQTAMLALLAKATQTRD